MPVEKNLVLILGLMFSLRAGVSQVVPPAEILDPQLHALQEKHLTDLRTAAGAISAHSFPYKLYFSRTLDLSELQQRQSDQHSIHFDKFQGQTVLQITANYYASYSDQLMHSEERARQTLQDVAVPILKATVPTLNDEVKLQSYALEISHHVRKKILGVTNENSENIGYVLPVAAARRLVAAKTSSERDAALIEGQLFVNREPVEGWGHDTQQLETKAEMPAVVSNAPTGVSRVSAIQAQAVPPPMPVEAVEPPKTPGVPAAIPEHSAPAATAKSAQTGLDVLKALQESHQSDLDRLVRDLDQQAHFVSYAPPAFVEFHKGCYLQFSMKTLLKERATSSQYQVAALAFDEHIAHLIRPILTSLKGVHDFDGIDFSTSVRLAGAGDSGTSVAVEFILPADGLNRYFDYDLTGQQLINMGFLLINGERVSVDLQQAEAGRE